MVGWLDHEGKKHTDDVDICAASSGAIVLVRECQIMVIADQLLLR